MLLFEKNKIIFFLKCIFWLISLPKLIMTVHSANYFNLQRQAVASLNDHETAYVYKLILVEELTLVLIF